MARIFIYTSVVLSLWLGPSVFASELMRNSTGVELVTQLELVMAGEEYTLGLRPEFQNLVLVDDNEARLARDFNDFLFHAFHAIAGDPSPGTIEWAVEEIYFIFARHAPAEVAGDTKKQKKYREVIRDFVQPLTSRSSGSCVFMLAPHMNDDIVH